MRHLIHDFLIVDTTKGEVNDFILNLVPDRVYFAMKREVNSVVLSSTMRSINSAVWLKVCEVSYFAITDALSGASDKIIRLIRE